MIEFTEEQRHNMAVLQKQIKPLLLNQEPIVAAWALADLVYFVAKLPRMHTHRSAIKGFMRDLAENV